MSDKNTYLICYDISEPKILRRVAYYIDNIGDKKGRQEKKGDR